MEAGLAQAGQLLRWCNVQGKDRVARANIISMKALRLLLLCFLLAGMSFQAYAAFAKLSCGPLAAAAPARAVPMAGAQHDHAAMLAAAGQTDYNPDTLHDGGQAKCASAAACCAGAPPLAALPSTPLLADRRSAVIPFVMSAPADVHLAGPERPPRPRLA
jgi:hypothetical protein